MKTLLRTVAILPAVLVAVCLVGCSDPPETQPAHNRTYITSDGQFVGHIKPVPPPVGPDGKVVKPFYPVLWVVDGEKVTRTEGAYDIHTFRLDFDEKQTLTEEILPFPLMTKESHEIIVHRGPPPAGFSHPKINEGETAYEIHHCIHRECPKLSETDNGQLFPVASGEDPVCPTCGQSETEPFMMPQQRDMRDVMKRQSQ